VKTTAVFLPFDLFGSAGTAAGAELLADAFREMLADNRRERVPTRARAYQGQVRLRELAFEDLRDYEAWRRKARQAARQAWAKDDFLLWVTGNHLGVLPVYDELAARGGDTLVVQLDAHLDIYNLTDCTAALSHGNFLLHCAGRLPALINVGHRELLLRPEHIAQFYRRTIAADELARDPAPALAELRQATGEAARVFIDLDCDVLDPACFPGTAHPVPFGLSPQLLLRLLDAAWSERVVGVAISEFAPARDRNDQSLAMLVWLLEYLLLRRYEGLPDGRSQRASKKTRPNTSSS
jgi:arginase family enzyme